MTGPFDWQTAAPHQVAVLDDVEVLVRCGLHPWERHPERPNRLRVSARLYSRTEFTGPGTYVDYDPLRALIVGWQGRDHVDLLETLLQEAVDAAFLDPLVDACWVRVVKPEIFPETRAAGVEWFKVRPA